MCICVYVYIYIYIYILRDIGGYYIIVGQGWTCLYGVRGMIGA